MDNNYSFKWSNLSNYSYKPKTELAVRRILDYNHLKILITYNYKTFTSGRTNTNKRKLTRVDIPSYYLGD